MKRISLDDLIHTRQNLTYQEQYEYICRFQRVHQSAEVRPIMLTGQRSSR